MRYLVTIVTTAKEYRAEIEADSPGAVEAQLIQSEDTYRLTTADITTVFIKRDKIVAMEITSLNDYKKKYPLGGR